MILVIENYPILEAFENLALCLFTKHNVSFEYDFWPKNYCVSTYIRNLTTQIAITVNDDTEEAPSQMNAPGSPQKAPRKPPGSLQEASPYWGFPL